MKKVFLSAGVFIRAFMSCFSEALKEAKVRIYKNDEE
jgi:hypothetical protein